jgi:hypothetical protein
MDIQNATFTDPSNSTINADVDGTQMSIPVAVGNRHYDEIVAQGIAVAPYVAPPPVTNDEIYDQVLQNQKVFKAYVLAVNDGSIVPGSNMTNAQLKAAVKAKM